jgi:RNA polymerase sigma factor (TIGR02999 family)
VCESETNSSTYGESDSSRLLVYLYDRLRRIAAAQVARAGRNWTLQATALVHEAWLRLSKHPTSEWRDSSHFVAAASETMRHILIDRARRRRAVRHGGRQVRVDIDQVEVAQGLQDSDELLALDGALQKLASCHPVPAALIRLQCFSGLDVAEAGSLLGLTRSAAYRRWLFARAWLHEELSNRL